MSDAPQNASRHDEDEEQQSSGKGGTIITLIVVIIVLVLGGIGAVFLYNHFYGQKAAGGEAATPEASKEPTKDAKAELIHLDNAFKQDIGSGLAEKKKKKASEDDEKEEGGASSSKTDKKSSLLENRMIIKDVPLAA